MSLDDERMSALRARFVASADAQAHQIEAALREGDSAAARAIAHGLAGRSALFGFATLGEIACAADEADEAALPARALALAEALRRAARGS